jgi:hypothetical protein
MNNRKKINKSAIGTTGRKALRRRRQLLELAGHPSRSSSLPALDLGRDLALCFSDKGTEIAVPHIRGDDDAAFAFSRLIWFGPGAWTAVFAMTATAASQAEGCSIK